MKQLSNISNFNFTIQSAMKALDCNTESTPSQIMEFEGEINFNPEFGTILKRIGSFSFIILNKQDLTDKRVYDLLQGNLHFLKYKRILFSANRMINPIFYHSDFKECPLLIFNRIEINETYRWADLTQKLFVQLFNIFPLHSYNYILDIFPLQFEIPDKPELTAYNKDLEKIAIDELTTLFNQNGFTKRDSKTNKLCNTDFWISRVLKKPAKP